jgi:hypothetical protein
MPHTPRALLTVEVVGTQDVTGAHNTSDPERSQTCHLENWDSDKAWREITEHGGLWRSWSWRLVGELSMFTSQSWPLGLLHS